MVKLNKNAKANFSFPANFNTAVLVIEGNVMINGKENLPTNHFALFENKGETFTIEATENTIVLVLSGEPLMNLLQHMVRL